MDLVKTLRLRAAVLGRSPHVKSTAKISLGLVAAVFLLQSYCVRELLFMEAAVVLGFVVVALIGAVCTLGYITALWLRKLGLKALDTVVSARHRRPLSEATITGLSEAKEEVC